MKEYRRLTTFSYLDYAKELQQELEYMGFDCVIEEKKDNISFIHITADMKEYQVYVKCDEDELNDIRKALTYKIRGLRRKDDADFKSFVESQTIVNEDEASKAFEKLGRMLYDVANKYKTFEVEVPFNDTLNNDPQEDYTMIVEVELDTLYNNDFQPFDIFERIGNQAITRFDLNDDKSWIFDIDGLSIVRPYEPDEDDGQAAWNKYNAMKRKFDDENLEYYIYDSKEFKLHCDMIVYDFMKKVDGQIIDDFKVSFKKRNNEAYIVLTKQSVVR